MLPARSVAGVDRCSLGLDRLVVSARLAKRLMQLVEDLVVDEHVLGTRMVQHRLRCDRRILPAAVAARVIRCSRQRVELLTRFGHPAQHHPPHATRLGPSRSVRRDE